MWLVLYVSCGMSHQIVKLFFFNWFTLVDEIVFNQLVIQFNRGQKPSYTQILIPGLLIGYPHICLTIWSYTFSLRAYGLRNMIPYTWVYCIVYFQWNDRIFLEKWSRSSKIWVSYTIFYSRSYTFKYFQSNNCILIS